MHSGAYSAGFKHGPGIEMGLHGRYNGMYDDNIRCGKGKLDLPNGDMCVPWQTVRAYG